MKDNRPIRQQVEELTDEQKAMLPKIRRNRAIFLLLILAAMLAIFLYASISCSQAEEEYETLCSQSDSVRIRDGYTQELENLIAERQYAKLVYENAVQRKAILIPVCCFCGIAGIVVCLFYYRTSYPYYTAKRYKYLRDNQRSKIAH